MKENNKKVGNGKVNLNSKKLCSNIKCKPNDNVVQTGIKVHSEKLSLESGKVSKNDILESKRKIDLARGEISKIVVGQREVVEGFFRAILANGHVLIEGVPGIAKTLISKSFAHVNSGEFKRIQFTTDLLPTDILGITAYSKEKGFYTIKGPIFANFILADEINRAPPKVQSAMLEAMQERQVTIGNTTFKLPSPFLVLATENPLEQMGVFPLPEAQLDRFLFKLNIGYPEIEDELEILDKNMSNKSFDEFNLQQVLSPQDIIYLQEIVRNVYVNKDVEKYLVSIVDATRNPKKYGIRTGKYIKWGASPRASVGLHIASKAQAVLRGKNFVEPSFVNDVAKDVLRHRILLNYEGRAKKIISDEIVEDIIDRVNTI